MHLFEAPLETLKEKLKRGLMAFDSISNRKDAVALATTIAEVEAV